MISKTNEIEALASLSGNLFDRSYILALKNPSEDKSESFLDILRGIEDLQYGENDSIIHIQKAFSSHGNILASLIQNAFSQLKCINDDNVGFFKIFALRDSIQINGLKHFIIGQFRNGFFDFSCVNVNKYKHIWEMMYNSILSESELYSPNHSVPEIPDFYNVYFYDQSITIKFRRLLSIMYGLLQEELSFKYTNSSNKKAKKVSFKSEREMEDWIDKELKNDPSTRIYMDDGEVINEESQYQILKCIDSLKSQPEHLLREFSSSESFIDDSVSNIKRRYKQYVDKLG